MPQRQRGVLSSHFWNGSRYYDNLNFAGRKVDHFWLDSQIWPIAWGFASKEQAAAIFSRIDAQPAFFEGVPMRWCPPIADAEAQQLARDYARMPREPHLRPYTWFGRLGAPAVMARRLMGQNDHAFALLDRYAQVVVKHGTCVECVDMDGNMQAGTNGKGDYLEHAGGLLLAAGRGILGIDDTADGTLVWRPWLPQGTTRVSIPYWRHGRYWTFGYEDDRYWIDPAGGQGTVQIHPRRKAAGYIAFRQAREHLFSTAPADARRAAEAANREAKRRYQVEPFSPNDFHRAGDESAIVLIAMVGMGCNDIQAEVCFNGDKPSEVVVTVLTNRTYNDPEFLRGATPPEQESRSRSEIKIGPGGTKGP